MTSYRNLLHVVRRALVLVTLASVIAVPAGAQSLAQAARDAEAKRKTAKSSGKVYTNDSLKPESPSSAPPASQPAAPAAPAPPADQKKDEPVKDEAYWRDRIKTEREALARAETFAAALQSQINGLYAEFTACQAPPQCREISAKRQKSIAELDRVKKEVETRTKAVADIQEEARRAGAPAGWVR